MKQAITQRQRAKVRRAQAIGQSFTMDSTRKVMHTKARYGLGATAGVKKIIWSSLGLKR